MYSRDLTIFQSTGKRRYGHPALTGVLPQPWLPLKKGQTLVNREQGVSNGKSSEAVVLTLRKRYSSLRKASRPAVEGVEAIGLRLNESRSEENGGYSDRDSTLINPWSEGHIETPSASVTPGAKILQHRLSFDDASGVIALPDHANWLMEEADSDSEEDVGSAASASTPTPHPHVRHDADPTNSNDSGPSHIATHMSPTSPSKQRHGTYFHHPERRRQQIPGAFPKI